MYNIYILDFTSYLIDVTINAMNKQSTCPSITEHSQGRGYLIATNDLQQQEKLEGERSSVLACGIFALAISAINISAVVWSISSRGLGKRNGS